MRFHKYHALGNDYIVLNPADFPDWREPDAGRIRLICHRNFGLGSDGILWGPLPSSGGSFGLRIFNPDGSEAEKSGNGTRIFARYLIDIGLAARLDAIPIQTPGGRVTARPAGGDRIRMAMGSVGFQSADIPVAGPPREVINETLHAGDRDFTFCAATIGNPHCVIPVTDPTPELARRYGPDLETHALFPHRINVQFLAVNDRRNIRIEIWERGAGYTLASGTSSSAAAAVARRLGLVDSSLTVHMPGGALEVEIGEDYAITMTGSVTPVAEGVLKQDIFGFRIPG
jgi:diaminopimelate epimerase